MNHSIVITKDGSPTIYVPEINEHYHSIHGALQESKHVFIKSGVEYFIKENLSISELNILEVGLGTHLNAITTLDYIKDLAVKVQYFGLEKYPVPLDFLKEYFHSFKNEIHLDEIELDDLLVSEENFKSGNFQLFKINEAIEEVKIPQKMDIIFFDAFAPNKQPELWEISIFEKLYNMMGERSILVTYCAKGYVKRNLKSAGFMVESIQGPPGKREMIRAHKNLKITT